MSAISGLATKGDKPKGKYTSININTIYKGSSNSQQKTTGPAPKHGLQSLGKVGSARRMPPPAHLPSLKSEHCGNDPNINLVPSGGSGWVEQENEAAGTTPTAPASATGAVVANAVSKPATPNISSATLSAVSTASVSSTSSTGQTNTNNGGSAGGSLHRQPLLQPQPGTSQHLPSQQQQPQQQQQQQPQQQQQHTQIETSQGGQVHRTSSGANGATKLLWSSVTSGARNQGGLVDQKSPFFQEEFPSLGPSGGEAEKSLPPPPRKEEESKEAQYGPGPSLRPQNVGSWREGGGRGAAQQQQEGEAAASTTQTSSPSPALITPPPQPVSSGGAPMPAPPQRHPHPAIPGGPMMQQFPGGAGGMMPPYMFGPRGAFPPRPFPPNFRGGPIPGPPFQCRPGDPRFGPPRFGPPMMMSFCVRIYRYLVPIEQLPLRKTLTLDTL